MMTSNMLPASIALIILLAITFVAIFVRRRFARYRQIAQTLPDARTIGQTASQELDEKRNALADALIADERTLPESEREIVNHALWTAMLLESVSDGTIDRREMEFVADLFSRLSEREMEYHPVAEAAGQIRADRRKALAEIAKAASAERKSKEFILAGAFLVSVSDHALADAETDCIGDISDALGLNQRDRKEMLTAITRRFGLDEGLAPG